MIRCRRCTSDNIINFLDLHRKVFGSWNDTINKKKFEWKYQDRSTLTKVPVFLALKNDKLVGARGYVVKPLQIGERQILGLQSSDLMVHPDWRGRGVYKRLNEFCDEIHASSSARVLFSFPRPRPRDGYRKGGWSIYKNDEYVASPVRQRVRAVGGRMLRARGWQSFVDSIQQAAAVSISGIARPACWLLNKRPVAIEIEPWQPSHSETACAFTSYGKHVGYTRTPEFYRWRCSEPGKSFFTATFYNSSDIIGLIIFNEQWGSIYIREVLSVPGRRAVSYVAMIYRLMDTLGLHRSYRLWSPLPAPLLAAIGFRPIRAFGLDEFRHDIAVRCYNMTPDGKAQIHAAFSEAGSGLSLLDFDC